MIPTQKRDDIADALRVACDVAHRPFVDADLFVLAGRLVRYHGKELFGKISWLPSQSGWSFVDLEGLLMPAGSAPVALGKNAPGSAFIERAEREAVVSGQSVSKAHAGAEMMRKAREAAEKLRQERERLHKKGPPPPAPIVGPVQKEAKIAALAALEDFGASPLDALDSF